MASGWHQPPRKPGVATLCEQLSPASCVPALVPAHLPSTRATSLMLLGGVRPPVPRNKPANPTALVGVSLSAGTWGWGRQKARGSCYKDGS